jgi:hypothetical protein
MKGKTLLVLVGSAVILGGVAVLTSRRDSAARPEAQGKSVLPGLAVNDVAEIRVTDGVATARVARVDGIWVAPETYNYPADFDKIRDALLKLADLKVGQVLTVDEEQRRRLKLVPPGPGTEADTAGTRIVLCDASGLPAGTLLVGDTRTRKTPSGPRGYGGFADGQYVSPDGGRTVYLVAEALPEFSPEPRQWLNTDLTSVTASDVHTVTIQHPGDAPIVLRRPEGGGDLEVQGLDGNEETDTAKMYSISSALSYLRLEDVADPAKPDAAFGLDTPVVYTAETGKGEVYTVRLGSSPEGSNARYARIRVALKPEPAVEAAETMPDATAEDDGMEAGATNATAAAAADTQAAAARRALEEDTAALNARLAPWTFLIASYKADAMTHTRASLVKEKNTEKKDDDER